MATAPKADPTDKPEASTPKFFRAVKGITDGFVHHVRDDVFAASPAIRSHFERTAGVQGSEVLYVPASEPEFDEHQAKVALAEHTAATAARGGGPMAGSPKAETPVEMAGGANA